MARRLANISNFGATWLKPPGVPKSLYQMREERREAEEHAEAVRREQLAAELAEAEAAQQAAQGMEGMMDVEGGGGEGMMGEGGEVDLDDDIPDADASGMGGFGYVDSDEDEDDEDDDEEGQEDDVDRGENDGDDGDDDGAGGLTAQQRRAQHRELATHEDRLRELLARGGDDAEEAGIYGAAGEEPDDEEVEGEMLEEEDLVHGDARHLEYEIEPGGDLDMDANLDDEIPEAESLGGYEHTDSDAELTSSEDDNNSRNVSFGPGRGGHRAPPAPARHNNRSSLASQATRQSLDISSILDSSTMGSSPQVRRRN